MSNINIAHKLIADMRFKTQINSALMSNINIAHKLDMRFKAQINSAIICL